MENASLKFKLKMAKTIKGFLDLEEGETLYNLAGKASKLGPCLEVGSYCGKSSVYIGTACKQKSTVLFSIDHHRGSEEQQPGEKYFDSSLLDSSGLVNTLSQFMGNILATGLEDTIIPILSKSSIVAKTWNIQLGMIFIDGSHIYEDVLNDYKLWHKHIIPAGYIVFHDIFKEPSQGGQAPYKVYKLAIASGKFVELEMIKSLGILQCKKRNL